MLIRVRDIEASGEARYILKTIESVGYKAWGPNSIGYPRMSASGESSTTKHRLLHASGSHPIPPPNDPKSDRRSTKNSDERTVEGPAGRSETCELFQMRLNKLEETPIDGDAEESVCRVNSISLN
ncbi:vacuolar protein sorting-associated protein 54, chloroplastic [Dorcoceras hygrometricum]|uniref:Vacuolar protein sorting-associated protein 54, chloroplastic n=1 Tax=Dorcoceras hygrometricum TaxID=472368 RepID=A0A2Z7DC59_9LAMI|nr:vacuolar protein sorting-associated protein 54, chloroplastic [Dorcoceras hygrometricum]